MAEKMKPRTIVRATTHPSEQRPNIPTAELESFARPEEKRPAMVRYPRDPTLDPQLVWEGQGRAGRPPPPSTHLVSWPFTLAAEDRVRVPLQHVA